MLEITVWDVNHGSATYIKTPNDRHIVVDLGDAGNFSPLQTLFARGVRHLDVAIVTHPHRDHLDDIFNLYLLSPRALWRPKHLSEEEIRNGNRASDMLVVQQYLQINEQFNGPLGPTDDLAQPANFGGAAFQVFVPRYCDRSNLNNHSLVVVASYAGLKIVIPGDNEATSWAELLQDRLFVRAVSGADILLAPHHGRQAGYCAELFEVMGNPRLIVISDGRFGDTSATGRYSNQARGWQVFDAAGASETRFCLTTRSDGHITIKLGWVGNSPQNGNFLNVTTSNFNRSALAALVGRNLGF
jgi:beta-lactamase superfamily II metal-dependent hydrolase